VIFLTVGSMFPFDRLVQSVDEMVGNKLITDTVVAQIGDGKYEPKHMAFDRYLAKPEYDQRVMEAEILVAHAGAGTIALALKHGKRLLVVPRRGEFREHVNDHQVVTARKYEEMGYVLVAQNMTDIPMKLAALRDFQPRNRETHPQDLARRIGAFLEKLISAGDTKHS